jgi:hypothetical protein
MTSNDISNFLTSISEAKRAYEAEPEYQRRIRDLERDKQRLGDTVAQRELRIHELKQTETDLLGKLRSVEAERDDAGFRLLEADDKVLGLLVALHQFINDGLKVISAVEGKESIVVLKDVNAGNLASIDLLEDVNRERQERVVELEAKIEKLHADMLQHPFTGATLSSQGEGTDHSFEPRPDGGMSWAEAELPRSVDEAPALEGQSEVDPTLLSSSAPVPDVSADISRVEPTTDVLGTKSEGQSDGPFAKADTTPIMQSETVSSQSAQALEDAVSNASQPKRNRDRTTFFKGRKYWDVTYFVPLYQWLNEGGTKEDYYWEPQDDSDLPQANRASHQS